MTICDVRLREFVFDGNTYDLCDELDVPKHVICLPIYNTKERDPCRYDRLLSCLEAQVCDHKWGYSIFLNRKDRYRDSHVKVYDYIFNAVTDNNLIVIDLVELFFDEGIQKRLISHIKSLVRGSIRSDKQVIVSTFSSTVVDCFYESDIIRI